MIVSYIQSYGYWQKFSCTVLGNFILVHIACTVHKLVKTNKKCVKCCYHEQREGFQNTYG